MGVLERMAGVPEKGGMTDPRLVRALSMARENEQELVAIANGAPPKNGVDSMYAVIALNMFKPLKAAARERQAQQPKQPSIKDQVVSSAMDAGLGGANSGNLMDEKTLAAGGIVAFQGGGTIEDLTKELNELKRQRQQALQRVSARGTPPFAQQSARELDTRITAIENKIRLAQNQSGFVGAASSSSPLERDWSGRGALLKEGVSPAEFGTPPDLLQAQQEQQQQQGQQGQQGQQPPGAGSGFGGGAPAGFPGVGASLNAAQAALKARGEFDPFASYSTFDPTQYSGLLPMTPEKLREQRAPAAAKLAGMFPQSREAAEELMAKRYAGLEGMYQKREARAEEAKAEAATEKGRTAGIGLLQIAEQLVRLPASKIDTSAAFQTFKDANTDFRKAQKEYREGLDKIAEARELQKIGQYEKADQLFREGAMAEFNFANETDKLAIERDATYKAGVRDIFDKKTAAQAAKLDANLKGAELQLSTALKGAELGSEERQAGIYAASRGLGQRFTYEEARTKARTEMPFDAFQQNWITSGASKQTGRKMPTQEDYERAIDARARSILSANEAYYSGQTAAPSGGGADRAGQFKVEKIG